METKLNVDLKTIILIVVLLVIGFGGGFTWLKKKLNNVNAELTEQITLNEALQAEMSITKNELNEVVASKQTLQANLDVMWNRFNSLNSNQKELLQRIKGMEKDNHIISAALIRSEAKIDSILYADVKVDVNEKDSTITFKEINDSIRFDITINKALRASPLVKPTIMFNNLEIPNEQFIKFYWDKNAKHSDPPVKFSLSNSNPMMKTLDLDSYVIPEVNANALQPTGWKKVGNWFEKRKGEVIVGGVCIGVGTIIGMILMK